MALITIQRRCNECDLTRDAMKCLTDEVQRYRQEVEASLLDYESLYDKVRTNLAKLARRESVSEAPAETESVPTGPSAAGMARLRALRRA